MNKESYTAASTFPSKLLHQKVIKDGKIIPIHIQLSPTNECNLNCSFCSCSDRDKKKSLYYDDIVEVLDVCAERGTKAMTITGGGEPLMFDPINEVIRYTDKKGIEVGLVTNGILLSRKLSYHPNLTWCRISSSDERIPSYRSIEDSLLINPDTDFAFSHVVTRNPNYGLIKEVIDFANQNNFSHIRLVNDLCDLDNTPNMGEVKWQMRRAGIEDSKVIYQGRKDSTIGDKDCYISLLKPVIASEGIFGCCGAQYAIHGQPKDMTEKMKMGDIKDLAMILDEQLYFNGDVCDVCYYSQYNSALSLLKNKPEHINFI